MVRAASSSSPSAKHISPEYPVKIDSIRPHASIAAGVSVFAWYDPLRGPGSNWDPSGPAVGFERPPRNKHRPKHQRVRLFRFDIDRTVWNTRSDLGDGDLTRFGVLQELVVASEQTFVVAIAAEILSRREHSATELRRKLRAKGFGSVACDVAVARLEDRGFQSDARFAEMWIRTRMRGKGVSRRALLATLAEKGVEREAATAAVAAYESEHPECFESALAAHVAAFGVDPGALDRQQQMRYIQRLTRKGFDLSRVKKYFA
ncbi:MAG: regulatory protein RecX [Alkalispirochaeta sp.]